MLDEDYNFFLKNENINTDSESISGFNENASTYMGVKTIQEGTIPDTDKKEMKMRRSQKKIKAEKNNKKRKKKSSSFSSNSDSSSYSFSSSSYEPYIEMNNDELINNKNINDNVDNDKLNLKNGYSSKLEESNKTNKKLEINKNSEDKINKNNEIKTEFYWDEGGDKVYITGSFCEWKSTFLMAKNDKGIHNITLSLTPGFYQYKFIVDDNWAYSKKQPKFEDNNGNVNNFIDTTDYIQNIENNNNSKNEKSENSPKNKDNVNKKYTEDKEGEDKSKELKRNSSTNSINLNMNYSTYIPLKGEFNIKPSSLPGLYKTCYILNEKKNKKVTERKFSQIEYVDQSNNSIHAISHGKQSRKNSAYNTEDSYVKFQNLYHIHSNHLHSKENIDSKNAITSIIMRYRAKFSTFIYYKDKRQKERSDKKHSRTVKLKEDLKGKIKKFVK